MVSASSTRALILALPSFLILSGNATFWNTVM